MRLILYTTKYREGGQKFKRVAETMFEQSASPAQCVEINSKRDFLNAISSMASIDELHFIGHSGMYGPMFGTVAFPEQFSPYEWKNMNIPFSPESVAVFHCCRSARWFAPFFADTFSVRTEGFHLYTSFSSHPTKFKYPKDEGPLYCFGVIGKKSGGILGSIKKYSGASAEERKVFYPREQQDRSYDNVAKLYRDVFTDIKVRADEWQFISNAVGKRPIAVIDIGCGNGALLRELLPNIQKGIGLDVSEELIQCAKEDANHLSNLDFKKIDGPILPFEDNSVDLAVSMLSFRYLDWDPLLKELQRVLKPNGELIVVDMVAVPLKMKELPLFVQSKIKHKRQRKKFPSYAKALDKLVAHPDWKKMLSHNPIRSEHEMKWYLESRFPESKVVKLNAGFHSCVLGVHVKDMSTFKPLELSFP